MWSALQKLGDFVDGTTEDLVRTIGQMASEVSGGGGGGGVYAGDEPAVHVDGAGVCSSSSSSRPQQPHISNEELLRFQLDPTTYTAAIAVDSEEAVAFSKWALCSPFCSPALRRASEAKHEFDHLAPPPSSTTHTSGGEEGKRHAGEAWVSETRQRLLDSSDAVLAQYSALVGHPTPRLRRSASPTTHDDDGGDTFDEPNHNNNNNALSGLGGESDKHQQHQQQQLSEDEFFDRYYFRLWRLRSAAAELRAAADEEARARRALESAERCARPSPHSDAAARTLKEEGLVLVRGVMHAASGLVATIDGALASSDGRDVSGSDDDNVSLSPHLRQQQQQKQKRKDQEQSDWQSAQHIEALEQLVRTLQEELLQERARCAEYKAIIDAHKFNANDKDGAREAGGAAASSAAAAAVSVNTPVSRRSSVASPTTEDDWERMEE